MSLIRQVWLLLTLTLVLAFAAAIGVSVHSARQYLQTQLALKNNDAAQAIALTLSQQHGEPAALEAALASQFDTGTYEALRLAAPGGRTLVERHAAMRATEAPAWFVELLGIKTSPGFAQVTDGWHLVEIGRAHV